MKKLAIALLGAVVLYASTPASFAQVEAATKTASTSGWISEQGSWYFYEKGIKKTGWLKNDGKWYYLDTDGKMKTGWLKDAGRWYYLDFSGVMKTGWVKLAGQWYYLDPTGAMKTGWVYLNNSWYYLTSTGAMKTGWLLDGESWYYLNQMGEMATGMQNIGNDTYYFNSDGMMFKGWLEYERKDFYFTDSGAMASGWTEISGNWYYLTEWGMAADTFVDGYYLNPAGIWITAGSAEIVSGAEYLKTFVNTELTKDVLLEKLGPDYTEGHGEAEGGYYWSYGLKVTGTNQFTVVPADINNIDDLANGKTDLNLIVYWDGENRAYYTALLYFDRDHKFHIYQAGKGESIYP